MSERPLGDTEIGPLRHIVHAPAEPDAVAGERVKCWRGECRMTCAYPDVCDLPAAPAEPDAMDVDALTEAADDWPEDGMTRAEAQRWLAETIARWRDA